MSTSDDTVKLTDNLNHIKTTLIKDINDGCLLVFQVGTPDVPVTKEEWKNIKEQIQEIAYGET